MNIQSALLPHKHVNFSESTIALAGRIRRLLIEPQSVDELWSLVNSNKDAWPSMPSFSQIVLAIDVLFAIGQVASTPEGRVYNNSARAIP